MSSDMMDTAPGGETPQYESIKTVTQPHSKESGQMGALSSELDQTAAATDQLQQPSAEEGEKTAEKIRFGQKMSEEGMGGTTTAGGLGVAGEEGGYGGTEANTSANEDAAGDAAQSRREQGYGGSEDMDRTIGA